MHLLVACTSFLETVVRIRVAGGERRLEGGQVAIELRQLGLAPGDGRPLGRDQWRAA
ncbi:MAG TPA: hypothetical protein VK194_09885 [Candidatus Deferrimicrobium sp.]|nr:hypothetical protein [Candidatus Deferrimicrobium sp.]